MGRILGMLSTAIVYLCVSTVISLCLLLGYALSKGYLEKDKVAKIFAIAQGLDAAPSPDVAVANADKSTDTPEQPSLEEIETRRAIHTRNLELREQSLGNALQRLQTRQRQVVEDKETCDRLKSAFEKQLSELHTGALATGRENIRLIWESIRPTQAKQQIVQMIEAGQQGEVVAILSAMPIGKRAKIIGEFKSLDDSKKLDELLDLIRRGMPEEKIINSAQGQLSESKPKSSG